ncbi:MAG: transferase [Pseudonocardiales bacterium]|nr:transferase [Pseudonocardiales bacterium]
MRILLWHVHGSWTTAFVQGGHDYLVPVLPDRGPDGLGRARTWDWPASVREVTPEELRNADLDAVVLQRPTELELVRAWTGRAVGRTLPAVYLEHNAPEPHPVHSRHLLADRDDIPLVHVTHFNQLFWDSGRARTTVIEHGVVDPGPRYSGELPRAAAVVNEPERRGRMVGADLFDDLASAAPLDVFGMAARPSTGTSGVRYLGDLAQDTMHTELARRRLYLHTTRWTSLGLALVEAMHLAMPIVAVAATEAAEAVPDTAGVVSTDIGRLKEAVRRYLDDPEGARMAGKAARVHALERYGLSRFLAGWDRLLQEVIGR